MKFAEDVDTRGASTRARNLRFMRIGLVIAGVIGGAILPFIAQEIAKPRSTAYLSTLDEGWISILVNAGYGALAGWALGALVAHLLGER